jgi:hypothetical protein
MFFSRKFLTFGVMLIGVQATLIGGASAATKAAAASKPKPANHIQVPQRLPQIVNRPAGKATAGSATNSSAAPAATFATRPPAGLDLSHRPLAINSAEVRTRIKQAQTTELQSVVDHLGNHVADSIKDRAKSVGTKVANPALGTNSSTLRSLEEVMPGFRERGKSGSTLKDMAGTGANRRNPVTNGQSMSNFIGDGREKYSDGSGVSTAYKDKTGAIVIVKDNGDIVTRYPNGDRQVDKPNGDREFTFADRKVTATPDVPLEPIDHSADKKGSNGRQGSKKEPTPDDEAGSSGRHLVTAADLHALAARRNAAGTPTGDEAGTGGPLDKSKTREGRIGQVGQPVNDGQETTALHVDDMQVKQALRLRLRNVTPIQRQ